MSFNKKFLSVFWKCLIIFGIIGALITGIIIYALAVSDSGVDYSSVGLNFSSVIYYTDGEGNEVEYDQVYGEQNRLWADISDMPEYLPQAFVAIEDERFYKHFGFDLPRTIKATFNYIIKRDSSFGGSTINQQLVKNITGYDDTTAKRKIIEIIRAIDMDRKLSKTQILELYLNTIYLSQGCNGVETAANKYFGKPVSDLTLAESASIAGITQYPTRYDPILNPEANKEKQELVLKKMLELEMISQEEYDEAIAEELNIQNNDTKDALSTQSYYTDHVIEEVIPILQKELAINKTMATQMIYRGGLQIYTTVEPKVQKAIDEIFSNPSKTIKFDESNPIQAAIIVIDPYTGQIKGVGGGLGKKTSERTLNRATMTLRQPGSSIKPLSVYAPGFEYKKFTPSTLFVDEAYSVGNHTIKNYYDGYRGTMTVKYAVEQSVNTVAAKALEKLGLQKSYDFLTHNLNFTSIDSRDKAYSPLALGGLTKGVSVLEMTAAYSAFVNKGIYTHPYTVEMIKDNDGKVIYEHNKKSNVAMSESTAATTLSVLKSVVDYGTGTPARLSNVPAGGKTGTTDDDKDRWFMGVTPYYAAGVWVGYDEPKTITGYGVNPAVALWKAVMQKSHDGLKYKQFDISKSAASAVNMCMDSGKLATDMCYQDYRGSRVVTEYVGVSNLTNETCDLHKYVQVDKTTGKIAGPECNLSDVEMRVQPQTGTEEICTHSSAPDIEPEIPIQ
ncbi:MAG: PBP1A family penicillin-binding protein [Clostridia bacterium]|nr:PBP1A family penicillin-binding protein [Clostridia bacterium]